MLVFDHPTVNYKMRPYIEKYGAAYILPNKPHGTTVSKSLVNAKSKVCEESVNFGKINSSGYLPDDMIKHAVIFKQDFVPREVVAMGPIASYIFAGETLKYSSGRIYEYGGEKVYVTFHPDSIFSSQRIASKFTSEFYKAIAFLERNSTQDVEKNCTTKVHENHQSYKSESDELAVDIETMHHDTIDCMSITDSNQDGDHWQSDIIEYPNENLNDQLYGKHLIFQNGSYDLTFMQRYMKFDASKITFDDTMILSRCLDPFELSSLDDLARSYTPEWSSWKQMVKHN